MLHNLGNLVIPDDKVLPLWRKQNNLLVGEIANSHIKKMENSEDSRLVLFAADDQLQKQIQNLNGVTYLGFSMVKVHIQAINK